MTQKKELSLSSRIAGIVGSGSVRSAPPTSSVSCSPHFPRWRASQLGRVALCPGSDQLESQVPEKGSSPEAESGTRIHVAMKRSILSGELRTRGLDDEESERASSCWDYFRSLEPAKEVLCERTFRVGDVGGTADVVLLYDDRVHVIDWKTGSAGILRTMATEQVRWYSMAAILEFDRPIAEMSVYCPATQSEYSDVFQRSDVPELEKRVAAVTLESQNPVPLYSPGYEQCLYCSAKTRCPAAWDEMRALVESTPKHLDNPKKLGDAYEVAKLAEKFASSVKSFIRERVKSGSEIDGWKAIHKRGRQYVRDVEAAFARSGLSAEKFREACSVSPVALKKLGIDEEALGDALGRYEGHIELRKVV